jgi:hypothetical protein
MKNIYILIIVCAATFYTNEIFGQGCVAVKNMSSCSLNWGTEQPSTGWQFSLNYRYFRSFRHFRGKEEETERVENGTEVINNDNSINLGISYTVNKRFTLSAIVPYVFIDRSSQYEHLGNSSPANPNPNNPNFQRFHTQSSGIGDIRVIGYYNTLSSYDKGSLIFGLGIKAPTGEYNAKDYFHKTEGLVLLPVDQSIQPGDGGWGYITEIDFNHHLKGKFNGYVNGMYMFNPRNTNGTLRSPNLTNNIPLSNQLSVGDQYMLRAGTRFAHQKFQAGLGGRLEGIPAKDLIGDSDGFRRPGYIVSVEPSVFYTHKAHTIGLNFPIALARNRTQSMLDKERTRVTGEYQHGDAAFANWLLSVTYAYRLHKM